MLLFRISKIMIEDVRQSIKLLSIYLLVLFSGLLYSGKLVANRLDLSIPDLFSVLFQGMQFIFILIPVFLLLLSIVLPPMFNTLRIIRWKSRFKLTVYVFNTVFLAVCIYLFIYMFAGFLHGYLLSGTLENSWITKSGYPYQFFEGKVDLEIFKTNNLVMRYVFIEVLAFLIIGLFAACVYVFTERFSVTFFIVQGLLLTDYMFGQFLSISLFSKYAQINLLSFVDMKVSSVIINLMVIIVILILMLYLMLNKKEFIGRDGEDHENY